MPTNAKIFFKLKVIDSKFDKVIKLENNGSGPIV